MKMRPLKSLISINEAHSIINANTKQIEDTEYVDILDLEGRVSAENISSPINVPPFRRAAMDGYAIKALDTFSATEDNPVLLECIDTVHAGEVTKSKIESGQCIQIATGAMVPDSADTVIQVELTEIIDDKIQITKPIAPGTNVSKVGVDLKKGDVVVRKGEIFTPGRIGALAAINKSSALVYRKPIVAIIPTGNEIAKLGTPLKEGQIYDINTYTIASLVKKNGGIPKIYDIIPDDYDALEKAILSALDADIILLSGGSSAGERDLNIDIIKKYGKIFFHGVQIKPGKPTLFGKIKDKLILNLPGYPTSCLTNGYIFLVPIMRKLSGLPPKKPTAIKAKMAKKIVSRLGRHQIFTVRVENGYAIPAFKESGAITSIAWADGYIEIPYNVDLVDKDEEVNVYLF
ncbi:MAG: molybdenum cofactor synthesis domain-containing protein [Promethearchaeota archaeon]